MRILCRPGEMMLKSRPVRQQFSRQLRTNMFDALKPVFPEGAAEYRISYRRVQANIFIETDHPDALEIARRVFGIVSVAQVHSQSVTGMDQIVAFAKSFFKDLVPGKRYAVRCRRVGEHPFTSLDVERTLGAALIHGARVDLTHPDIVCRVNIVDDAVDVFTDSQAGAGGLPLGTQGRAVCLISGGIDSPVAAWYAMKRGLHVDYLFCNLGGDHQLWGPKTTARYLARNWSYGYKPAFYTVDFTELLAAFTDLDHRYRNILLKRYFYRAADRLASRIGADGIITGEALGQVSSQTLSNLRTITEVTDRLVMRPLIAMDKTAIIADARKIGTLEASEKVPEYCNVAVRKPRTKSNPEALRKLEESISEKILDRAFAQLKKEDLRTMSAPDHTRVYSLKTKPSHSRLIWIRGEGDQQPVPETVDDIINQTEIRSRLKKMDLTGIILVGCERGLLSRDVVSYLRDRGTEAYMLTG